MVDSGEHFLPITTVTISVFGIALQRSPFLRDMTIFEFVKTLRAINVIRADPVRRYCGKSMSRDFCDQDKCNLPVCRDAVLYINGEVVHYRYPKSLVTHFFTIRQSLGVLHRIQVAPPGNRRRRSIPHSIVSLPYPEAIHCQHNGTLLSILILQRCVGQSLEIIEHNKLRKHHHDELSVEERRSHCWRCAEL